MTAFRFRLAVAFASLLALTVGQSAAQTPFDSASIRTATIGQLLTSARTGDSIANTQSTFAAGHAIFERLRDRLSRPALREIQLQTIANTHADFTTVLHKQPPSGLTALEAASLDSLARVMQQLYPRLLTPLIGGDSVAVLLNPVVAFQQALRNNSMLNSYEKLNRFERKYGPSAPSRNIAEVVLNFGAQWVPGFRANEDGWPSRVEVITSYVPTYVQVPLTEWKSGAVTVAEVGVRTYVWQQGWGGDQGGVLRPGYISFGMVVAGERDGAMMSPFKGSSRFGAFFGWGDAKIALIGGQDARLLVTRTFHVVPWAF